MARCYNVLIKFKWAAPSLHNFKLLLEGGHDIHKLDYLYDKIIYIQFFEHDDEKSFIEEVDKILATARIKDKVDWVFFDSLEKLQHVGIKPRGGIPTEKGKIKSITRAQLLEQMHNGLIKIESSAPLFEDILKTWLMSTDSARMDAMWKKVFARRKRWRPAGKDHSVIEKIEKNLVENVREEYAPILRKYNIKSEKEFKKILKLKPRY